MLYLEALNENGTVRWRDADSGLLEFRYTSQFCGSCCFLGRVIESPERGLSFSEGDLIWEDFSLKRGNSRALYKNALVFFEQYLRRQRSVEKFHCWVSSSSGQGLRDLIRRLLGRDVATRVVIEDENGAEPSGNDSDDDSQMHSREETDRTKHSNGNGNGHRKEDVQILELDLKRYAGGQSVNLDIPHRPVERKSRNPVFNQDTPPAKGDRDRHLRTPLLPFFD